MLSDRTLTLPFPMQVMAQPYQYKWPTTQTQYWDARVSQGTTQPNNIHCRAPAEVTHAKRRASPNHTDPCAGPLAEMIHI